LWSKVYLSEASTEHWITMMQQENFQGEAIFLLAPSDGILNLMALANEWAPTVMTTRKTAYEIPYHSLILLFTHE
jgi:hypothetical protein